MTDMMMTKASGGLATLETYEARIDLYKEQIVGGYLGIGRTLLEAKAAGVVPHGQWETWATGRTGLSIRHVQRCMQAAREIDESSPLARLDMSKALLLLSSGLDTETRDSIGAAAAEEQVSVSELRRQIAQAREQGKADAYATAREQAQKDLLARLDEAEEEHAQELRRARDDARQAAVQQQEYWRHQLHARENELRDVQSQVDAARAEGKAAGMVESEHLRQRLEQAEDARQAAQQELLMLRSAQASASAGSGDAQGLTPERFARATRTYLAEVAELPYMGSALAGMDSGDRYICEQQLRRLSDWLQAAQAALRVQVIDVTADLDELLRDGLYDRDALMGGICDV